MNTIIDDLQTIASLWVQMKHSRCRFWWKRISRLAITKNNKAPEKKNLYHFHLLTTQSLSGKERSNLTSLSILTGLDVLDSHWLVSLPSPFYFSDMILLAFHDLPQRNTSNQAKAVRENDGCDCSDEQSRSSISKPSVSTKITPKQRSIRAFGSDPYGETLPDLEREEIKGDRSNKIATLTQITD